MATLERIAQQVWAHHYEIPRFGYTIALVTLVAILGVVALPPAWFLVGAGMIVLTLIGLVRWMVARRRCLGALVVPLFHEGRGAEARAEEVQRIIVDSLQRQLPHRLQRFVQKIPAVLGPDDRAATERLQRRLRASFILHGRIASGDDGGWSVYPRVLEPANASVTHLDWHTRDKTPSTVRFGPIVSTLPAQIGVRDEEFPFEFCRDLEALVRGLAGLVAHAFGDSETAEELLGKALEVAGDSRNAQIDSLRVARARALADLGELDEALEVLTARSDDEPSPYLLRGLAALLLMEGNEFGPEDGEDTKDAAVECLERALEDERDPQRDMSIYNLLAIRDPSGDHDDLAEKERLLDELLRSKSGYHRQWYVHRMAGLLAWMRSTDAWNANDAEGVKRLGRLAGKHYAKAIRLRPRLQVRYIGLRRHFFVWTRFPPSPILYGNAVDARRRAGQRIRRTWLELRFRWIRRKLMRRAKKRFEAGQWELAYANYDWVGHVGRHDGIEVLALVGSAVSLYKADRIQEAEFELQLAKSHGAVAEVARSYFAEELRRLGQDETVPGGPIDEESVTAMVDGN